MHQLHSVCRTEKKISTYKKCAHNSSQGDSGLLADHINAKLGIVSAISKDLLGRQYNAVVQPAEYSLE